MPNKNLDDIVENPISKGVSDVCEIALDVFHVAKVGVPMYFRSAGRSMMAPFLVPAVVDAYKNNHTLVQQIDPSIVYPGSQQYRAMVAGIGTGIMVNLGMVSASICEAAADNNFWPLVATAGAYITTNILSALSQRSKHNSK